MWSIDEMQAKIAATADRRQTATAIEGAIRSSGCWRLRGHVNVTTGVVTEQWRSMNSYSITEIKAMVRMFLENCCYADNIEFFQTQEQMRTTMEDALYFSVRYTVNAAHSEIEQIEMG